MNGINCLLENKYFYALHKPQKVPFHSLDEKDSISGESVHVKGMVSLAKSFLNDENIFPVHRLDRMTSGLMIFARSSEVNSSLSKAFADKEIEKYYLAISLAKPKKKQGAIIGDMEKSRSGSYKLMRSVKNPAMTRFFSKKIILDQESAWLSILKPETGKTHQLRVALKSLGSPIYGDTRYGGLSASRGYLHAYKIRFKLFDTLYEIIDPLFSGEEFDLASFEQGLLKSTDAEQANLIQFLQPETLPWPKSGFLIS